MKWLLDNVAKFAALLSFGLITATTLHDWGYFWVIGSKFRSIQTTYDYLTGAIEWLPQFLILSAVAWVLADRITTLLSKEPSFGFDDRRRAKERRGFMRISIGSLAIALIGSVLSLLDPFPTAFGEMIVCLSFLSVSWGSYQAADNASQAEDDPWYYAAMVVVFATFIFSFGIADGNHALKNSDVYLLEVKGSDRRPVSLLRSFEKGALIFNAVDNRIEFVRWENIDKLSRTPVSDNERGICRYLKIFCSEQPTQF